MPKVYVELDNLSREGLIQLLLDKEEEMETLKTIIVNNDLEQKADWKHIEELEEKCENLKSDVSIYKSQMNTYKKKYLALLKSNTELEEENIKLKDNFMLKLAQAYLLPTPSNQMALFKQWKYSKWYDEVKNQMRKEIKEEKSDF